MAAAAAALDPSCAPAPADLTRADINRANALHSTGPRSAEGKKRSSLNALKFGLFASLHHLPPAELAIFDQITFTVPYADHCEHPHLQTVALKVCELLYRLDRVRRLEYSTYAERMRALCEADGIPEPTDLAERGILEARIFREDSLGPRLLQKLHTHERFFTRELEKTRTAYRHLVKQLYPPPPDPALQSVLDELASFSERPDPPSTPTRSAPCPCGSGLKYKRCCGKNAPPHLNL